MDFTDGTMCLAAGGVDYSTPWCNVACAGCLLRMAPSLISPRRFITVSEGDSFPCAEVTLVFFAFFRDCRRQLA